MADSEISDPPPPPLPPGKKWSTEWLEDEVLPYLHWLAGEGGDFSKGSPVYEYVAELLTKKEKACSLSGAKFFVDKLRKAYEEEYGTCRDATVLKECLDGIKRDLASTDVEHQALPYAKELLELVEEFGNMTQTKRNEIYRKGAHPIPVDDPFFKRIKESPWGKEQYDCFSERPEACKERNKNCDATTQKKKADGQKLEIPHNTAEIVNAIVKKVITTMEKNQHREGAKDSARLQLAATAVYLLGCYAMSGRPNEWAPGCAMSGEKDTNASRSSDVFEIDASGRMARFKCVNKTGQLSGSARDTNWRVLMLPLSTFNRLAACLDHEWDFVANHERVIKAPRKWFVKSIKFDESSLWETLRTAVERHGGIKFTPYNLKDISVALLPHSYHCHDLSPSGVLELQKLQCGHYTASSTQNYLKVAVKNPEKIVKKMYITMNRRDLLVSEAPVSASPASSDDESSENLPIADDSEEGGDDEEEAGSSFGDGSSVLSVEEAPAIPTEAGGDEPAPKRIKVHHDMLKFQWYKDDITKKEEEGGYEFYI